MRTRFLLVLAVALALGLAAGVLIGGETASADPTPYWFIQVPVLGSIGGSDSGVEWIMEIQNLGDRYTKAEMWFYGGYSGMCEPQDPGPLKVECTGSLKPGSSWIWTSGQMPSWAKSAWIFAVDECGDAPDGNGVPLGVEVVRKGPDPETGDDVSAAYSAGADWAFWDPVFGGYAFYAPVVFAGYEGYNSWIYIQNSGDQCTSVELWFKAVDDCLRAVIDEVLALAPGETYQFDVSTAVGPGFVGSAWIRATQPLGLVVDHVGNNVLMSYVGKPADVYFPRDGTASVGSQVAYGPLIYREEHGWETWMAVQNLSSIVNAKVKVYFLDNSGDIIKTLVDWVCPRGNQLFVLPYINGLPGNYVGTVRVESQNWWSSGDPPVSAPSILAVAHLIKYSGPSFEDPMEAIAYNLFPEWQAYDWQVGENWWQGARVIGIPSLMKQGLQVTTELAIQNVLAKPGFTDFAIFIYDQNGLLDYVCEKLNEKQSEYINLDSWGYINPGFKGSAVIEVRSWEHKGSFSPGLAAVKVERSSTVLGYDIPGDESAGSEGFPVYGPFGFQGYAPDCPGEPGPCLSLITGVVRDADTDEPIPDVHVWTSAGEAWTDGAGRYTVYAEAGGFVLWGSKEGYYPDHFAELAVACNEPLIHDFWMTPGEPPDFWCVSGVAHLGDTCDPAATDVRLVDKRVELWKDGYLYDWTYTDSEGFFGFCDLPEQDDYHLKILIDGVSFPSEDFTVMDGDQAWNFHFQYGLPPTGTWCESD